VVIAISRPVAISLIVTFALGRTAPAESVTIPSMEPVDCCDASSVGAKVIVIIISEFNLHKPDFNRFVIENPPSQAYSVAMICRCLVSLD
jgi:hypothetical protein